MMAQNRRAGISAKVAGATVFPVAIATDRHRFRYDGVVIGTCTGGLSAASMATTYKVYSQRMSNATLPARTPYAIVACTVFIALPPRREGVRGEAPI